MTEGKNCKIEVRVTMEEKRIIKGIAGELSLSMSQLIRFTYLALNEDIEIQDLLLNKIEEYEECQE